MKQSSPWPSAIHSKRSSARPSSRPVAKILIFEAWPSLKPRAYPRSSASSSFLSRVWRSARCPSLKVRSHKYSRFQPSGVDTAVERKSLMDSKLASLMNSRKAIWAGGARVGMLGGGAVLGVRGGVAVAFFAFPWVFLLLGPMVCWQSCWDCVTGCDG